MSAHLKEDKLRAWRRRCRAAAPSLLLGGLLGLRLAAPSAAAFLGSAWAPSTILPSDRFAVGPWRAISGAPAGEVVEPPAAAARGLPAPAGTAAACLAAGALAAALLRRGLTSLPSRRAGVSTAARGPSVALAAAGVTGTSAGRAAAGEEEGPRAAASGATRRAAVPEAVQLVTDVKPDEGPEGTYKVGIDFRSWLQSCKEELEVTDLRVEGKIPAWLRGSLVHAGPAKFEFGDDEFVDWVDGQAMLYRIRITPERCEYRNRWLDTWNHRSHREAGRIAVRETCSRPTLPNFWERFLYMFQPPNNENGNLHISQFAGQRCCSMSVGSALLEFTLPEMQTLGKVPFADNWAEAGPLIFHSEPHVDSVTGEWFTTAIQLKIVPEQFGLKPEYVVYSVLPTEAQEPGAPLNRRLIARVQTEHPAPVHTIAVTEKYIVMIQIPYPLNWDGMINAEKRWLLTGKYEGNLNDYNTWQPERPTLIRLIDRETGEQVTPFETDPFFFFHTINAYEEGSFVYIDVVCYNEPPVGFPLRQARSGDVEDWRGGGGEVRRFKLDLTTGKCTSSGWPDNCFDEPKINPKVDGLRHRYSFGLIDDHGMLRLTKQDHDTHEVVKWKGQDVTRELPWQPVFIPEPYSDREDSGVVLSFVRDQPTGNTFCVVVNTETMEECARIHLPEGHHIPLHGHGMWMPGQF